MSIATIAAKAARRVVGDVSTPDGVRKFNEARAVAEHDLAASLHLASVANGEESAASAFEAQHGVPLSVEDRAGAAHAVDVAKYQELRRTNPFEAARVGRDSPAFAYAEGMSEGKKTEELRAAQHLPSNPPASPNLNPFSLARANTDVDKALEAQARGGDPAAERAWARATPDATVDQFGQPKEGNR